MTRHVEQWGRRDHYPTMRIECRILILSKEGTPLREFERFYCEYVSGKLAVRAYQFIRRFFAREKKKGRTGLADSPTEDVN